jgi:hypothetical protein
MEINRFALFVALYTIAHFTHNIYVAILFLISYASVCIGSHIFNTVTDPLVSISGRIHGLLINFEKVSMPPVFEENVDRFVCFKFSTAYGHDPIYNACVFIGSRSTSKLIWVRKNKPVKANISEQKELKTKDFMTPKQYAEFVKLCSKKF